jgi:hypothetical protein
MGQRTVKPASIAAQALGWVDATTRAVAPPIHTSTTFIRDPTISSVPAASMRATTTRRSTRPKPC